MFDAFVVQSERAGVPSNAEVDRRWFPIFAALRNAAIDRQQKVLGSLADDDDLAFVSAYALGSLFSEEDLRPDTQVYSDEDYSLLVESLCHSGKLPSSEAAVRPLVDSFLSKLPQPRPASATSPIARVPARFQTLMEARPVEGIRGLRNYASDLKRSAIHLVGPDLLTALQALLDPGQRLSDAQLPRIFRLLTAWRLDRFGYAMLFARLLGDYPDEQAFLKTERQQASVHLTEVGHNNLHVLLAGSDPEPFPDALNAYEDRLLYQLALLNQAMRNNSSSDTAAGIARLYALDPALVEFLPWNRAVSIVQQARLSSPAAAFTAMLTTTRPIRRAYPGAWLRMGNGAFIAALSSIVPADAKSDVAGALLTRFRELPHAAGSAMAYQILEPEMFDRLIAAALAPRVIEGSLGQESSFSLLRIEALRSAERQRLISADFANEQIAHETDQARLQSFQTRMRAGRVRVPWNTIRDAAKTLVEAIPFELMSAESVGTPGNEVVERLTTYFAVGYARQVCLEANNSINQALSDNLRHGFVIPRFLRAFDDALQTTLSSPRRHLPQWDPAGLNPIFGSEAHHVIGFRDWVNEELKAYQEGCLTVEPDGGLVTAIGDKAASAVMEEIRRPQPDPNRILRAVQSATEQALRKALAAATKNLEMQVKPRTVQQLNQVRRAVRSQQNHVVLQYLDGLEARLHHAFDEVGEWIGIYEETEDDTPFKLDELVRLELASMHSANWRRLSVSVFSTDSSLPGDAGDLLIKGRHFGVFQNVVHNLLSNAFRHSGQALRTQVQVSLSMSETQLVLECRNTLGSERLIRTRRELAQLQKQARRPLDAQAAEDTLSGFLKMRLAILQAFGRQPEVSITLDGSREPMFLVKLLLTPGPRIWNG